MNNQETVTLLQLQEFIRRVLALNLPEALWVEAEISEISISRGHRYLSLIYKEPGAEEPSASGNAVIWQGQWSQLLKKHGEQLLRELSQPGVLIRMKAKVEFHERYGLKLNIEDLDPTYTFGLWELKRKEVLQRLQREGLPGRNAALNLPLVPQRIAVISTEQGAGYQDFIKHLQQNTFGYRFSPTLFAAVVQGARTAPEIVEKLSAIEHLRKHFDCTVIIRGGGSKVDLSAFDHYDICRAIAYHPQPVLTGIGHEVDESLADKVAHHALKTPTAVADFLIHRIWEFENAIFQAANTFQALSKEIIGKQAFRIEQLRSTGAKSTIQAISNHQHILDITSMETGKLFKFFLHDANIRLDALHQLGIRLNPQTLLERGYTLTLKNGQMQSSIDNFRAGDHIETILSDGRISSTVIKTSKNT
jgi:exodeoxyribonuclease VII large subunit